MQTKTLWPSSSRDCLVMSFIKALDDGRYINLTKSIDSHTLYTDEQSHVRMVCDLAGLVVQDHPSGDLKRSRCVQIIDGSLGGWFD